MAKKKRFQRHFRKFHEKKTTGHPQYVYDDDGKEYKIIGITGAPFTNGEWNIPLDRNPEPGKSRKAYLRPHPDKINKGVRNEKLNGWKFIENDKKKVEIIISSERHRRNKKRKGWGHR